MTGSVPRPFASRRLTRFALALACGAALALALAPLSFGPAITAYAALLGLSCAVDRDRRRPLERFALGFAFGFAFHLAGLWWVGMAFLVDTDAHGALLPFGVLGLPLLLAPFHGAALALTGFVPPRIVPRLFALAGAIALTELARGVVLSGFPWNVPAAQGGLLLGQGAALLGVEGLAVPVVLIGAAPALVFARGTGRWVAGGAVAAVAAGLVLYGAHRLGTEAQARPDDPLVRVVQPNIAQADKWAREERERIWMTLLDLTARPSETPPGLIVWPETALPFLYSTPSLEQLQLAAILPEGAQLITGAVEIDGDPAAARATNSVLVLDDRGERVARYDKVLLVPFGEYLPLRGVLSRLGLSRIVGGAGRFSAGAGPRTLETSAGAVQPLVCYEVIFPRFDAPDARFLVNLTNDAWFGDTPGPHQHLRLTQLRAIASGLPIARAANTGISAMIDRTGRLQAARALGTEGIIDARVPPAAATVAAKVGVWGPLSAILAAFLAAFLCGRQFFPRS